MIANVRRTASFAQWWRPANWLRLVYGVCLDQRWYWRQIRPQLDGKLGGLLMLQATLGALLCLLILALPPFALLYLTGQAAHTNELIDALIWCVALTLVHGLLMRLVQGNAAGVPYMAASGLALGLSASLSLSVALLANAYAPSFNEPFGAIQRTLDLQLLDIFGPAIGFYGGLCRIVIDGAALRYTGVDEIHVPSGNRPRLELLAAWLLTIVLTAAAGVLDGWRLGPDLGWLYVELLGPILGALSGYYLGVSWGGRQVLDEALRKRLANPAARGWDETIDELSARP